MRQDSYQGPALASFAFRMLFLTQIMCMEALDTADWCFAFLSVPMDCESRLGSEGRLIRLWNVHTWSQIGIHLEGHSDVVLCVPFSPVGRRITSSSRDETLRLWDTDTFTRMGSVLKKHLAHCVSITSDGRRIVSGGSDGTAGVWNVKLASKLEIL